MITLISNEVQTWWQIHVAERRFQTYSEILFPNKLPELSAFKSSVELTLVAFSEHNTHVQGAKLMW